MANYKIYIHGRPQGQDCYPLWDTNDRFYIEPFLDMRIGKEYSSFLISDIFQGNAYYTFIVNKKVLENHARRDNSYFAITIRFDNSYSKKIHVLYELLNAVYKEKCIGTLLHDEGQSIQFTVSKMSEKESVLKEISAIIKNNIDRLLSSAISPTKNVKDTTQTTPKYYSLEEVDSPMFVSDLLTSKVIVSPDISSALDRLNSLSGIKAKYDNLQVQYKEQSGENKRLQEERDSLKEKLKDNSAESSKAASKIAAQKKEIENLKIDKNIFQAIELNKESIIQFARLVASRFPEKFKMDFPDIPSHPKKPSSSFNPKDWLLVGSFVLLLVLLGLNIYNMVDHKGGYKDPPVNPSDTVQVDSVKTGSQVPTPEVRIDIGGYSKGDLIIGKTYSLSVNVNHDSYKGGTFEVIGGTVDVNNKLTVTDISVSISYLKDGNVLVQRELNAKFPESPPSPKKTVQSGGKVKDNPANNKEKESKSKTQNVENNNKIENKNQNENKDNNKGNNNG